MKNNLLRFAILVLIAAAFTILFGMLFTGVIAVWHWSEAAKVAAAAIILLSAVVALMIISNIADKY